MSIFALIVLLALTAPSLSAEVVDGPEPDLEAGAQPDDLQQAQPADSRTWVRGKFEIPSRYYYRGFAMERDGFIAQPAARLGIDLWRSEDGPIQRVSTLVGQRMSFHSEQSGAVGNGPSSWFESDLIGGFQVLAFDRLQAELLYANISSPNGAFATIEEIDLNLSYNDRGLWPGDFSLDPYTNFKFEIANSAAAGPQGTLMQLGIAPGFSPFGPESLPLRVSFPIEAGISLDDYYFLPAPIGSGDDETLGYTKFGASAMMPLFFLPRDYGLWAVTVGVDYIQLEDNLTAFNQGRDDDFIARVTFNFQF